MLKENNSSHKQINEKIYTHLEAVKYLGANFVIYSSGNCINKKKANCTSLSGIRQLTLNRIKDLQIKVGIKLVITGGTETGHSLSKYSHQNGYKVDLRTLKELNTYIANNYEKVNDYLYLDPFGNTYHRHGPSDHWDVLITH